MIFEIPRAWPDHCNHPADSYIGSFECRDHKYDVCIYPGRFGGDNVCIRFGENAGDYYSCGPLPLFYNSANIDQIYKDAAELIASKGTIHFRRKPPTT